MTKLKCPECGRVFDLILVSEANEWFYGHDCEDPPGKPDLRNVADGP